MRGGRGPQGYTIVEVMIFLAVSSALLLSAMALISAQQRKTRFSQGSKDMVSQLQDIVNIISTGYYINSNNYKCSDSGNGDSSGYPTVSSSTANNKGANYGCTFIGHVFQFSPDGS